MKVIALILSLAVGVIAQSVNLSPACVAANGLSDPSVGSCVGTAVPNGLFRTATTYGTSYCDNPSNFEWPDTLASHYGFTIYNQCATGRAIADPEIIGRMQQDSVYQSSLSIGDLYGNDLYNWWGYADFARVYTAAVAWRGVPNALKSFIGAVTDSGSWSETSLYGVPYLTSSTAGDRITFTFNGTAVIIGSLIRTTGGSYSVTVDGVDKGTFSSLMAHANVHNVTLAPSAIVISGLASGNHVARITNVGSGNRYFQWFYGNGNGRLQGPMVITAGATTTTDSGFSPDRPGAVDSARAYTAIMDTTAQRLYTSMGLNTFHAPYLLDGATDFYDANHYNALGARKIADSVWNVFQNMTVQQALNYSYNTNLRVTGTVALSGCESAGTGTATFARNGSNITLAIPDLSCTSNGTTGNITGVPEPFWSGSTQFCAINIVTDNGVDYLGWIRAFANGTFTIYYAPINVLTGAAALTAGFTASGTKGMNQSSCSLVR